MEKMKKIVGIVVTMLLGALAMAVVGALTSVRIHLDGVAVPLSLLILGVSLFAMISWLIGHLIVDVYHTVKNDGKNTSYWV